MKRVFLDGLAKSISVEPEVIMSVLVLLDHESICTLNFVIVCCNQIISETPYGQGYPPKGYVNCPVCGKRENFDDYHFAVTRRVENEE